MSCTGKLMASRMAAMGHFRSSIAQAESLRFWGQAVVPCRLSQGASDPIEATSAFWGKADVLEGGRCSLELAKRRHSISAMGAVRRIKSGTSHEGDPITLILHLQSFKD